MLSGAQKLARSVFLTSIEMTSSTSNWSLLVQATPAPFYWELGKTSKCITYCTRFYDSLKFRALLDDIHWTVFNAQQSTVDMQMIIHNLKVGSALSLANMTSAGEVVVNKGPPLIVSQTLQHGGDWSIIRFHKWGFLQSLCRAGDDCFFWRDHSAGCSRWPWVHQRIHPSVGQVICDYQSITILIQFSSRGSSGITIIQKGALLATGWLDRWTILLRVIMKRRDVTLAGADVVLPSLLAVLLALLL